MSALSLGYEVSLHKEHKLGINQFRITTAPSLGPLLGGALAYQGGWRWVFWFLTIASSIVLTTMALILPETARTIVGNGSIPPPRYSRPWVPTIMRPWKNNGEQTASMILRKRSFPNPLRSLKILCRPDTGVSILAGSILYMVYCSSHASLSTVFSARWPCLSLSFRRNLVCVGLTLFC